jgi:hypothetical protein
VCVCVREREFIRNGHLHNEGPRAHADDMEHIVKNDSGNQVIIHKQYIETGG